MDLVFDANELRCDASGSALAPDAALEDVIDSEFTADLSDRLFGVLVGS